jgi:Tol biopolymer transport system component
MSVIDNALNPAARATIYHKGPLAARLLQKSLGDELFDNGMRQLVARFGQQQIGDREVEATFTDVAKQDVHNFFETWIRSDAMMDLALDPHPDGGAVARNHGPAWAPTAQQLLQVPQNGEPEPGTVDLGATTTINGVGELILDPGAVMPDVYRGNNVFPPRRSPRFVAVSPRGELLVVYGDTRAWSPLTASHLSASGQPLHEWDLERGLASEPVWAPDGLRALYAENDRNGVTQLVALNTADGSRTTIGHDRAAVPVSNGLIVARGDRLVHVQGEDQTTIVQHPERDLGAPLIAPNEKEVAYTASGDDLSDLRVVGVDGSNDRLILSWQRTGVVWRWSPDGAHLFALLPGDWDWELWEIPTGRGGPRVLVREAAAIHDLAIAADGQRVALTAVPTIDDPNARADVFVVDLASGAARRLPIEGQSAERLSWLAPDELLVVSAESEVRALPRRRQLQRLMVSDGSSHPFP